MSWGGSSANLGKWRAFGFVNSQNDERCFCPPQNPMLETLTQEDVDFLKGYKLFIFFTIIVDGCNKADARIQLLILSLVKIVHLSR